MFEDTEKNNIFPINSLIENYSTIMAIFANHGVERPFLYRSNTVRFAGKMLFIFTTPLIKTKKLYDELEPYFGFAFRLLNLSDLERQEQRALSFPQTPSVLLTPDLLPQALEVRVREIFGGLWATPHADWIIATHEELKKNTRLAKERLDQAVLEAASYQKIISLPSVFSQAHENIFITHLIIQRISFSFEMLLSLQQLLATPSTLRQLCLSHNALTEKQALLLQTSFESNHALTSLDISHNKIGKSAEFFGYLLATHPALESLDIGNNNIETNIAEAFEYGVTRNTTLSRLGLSQCFRGKWNEWEIVLRKIAANQTLTSLDISYNDITSQQLSSLKDFLQPLKLVSLFLHGNSFTAQDLPTLTNFMETQSTLKTFFLDIRGVIIQRDPYYDEPYSFHPCFYSFIFAVRKNTSLRHIVFNMYASFPTILTHCLKSLKQNATLEKIEFLEQSIETAEAKTVNALFRKNRTKILDRRKAFIYTLLLLNHLALWQALPLDIKLVIFHKLFINQAFNFGKSHDQILGCARFIFSHTQKCSELIKTSQKVVIIEKETSPRKYSFEFFKAVQEKVPATLVAHKNMPLALFKKTFPRH